MKKAVDVLIAQCNVALELAADKNEQADRYWEIEVRHYKFTVELCNELLQSINDDAELSYSQVEFLIVKVRSVGYESIPGSGGKIRYHDAAVVCPLLVLQLSTYINSCK